jgi:hypothetical protein
MGLLQLRKDNVFVLQTLGDKETITHFATKRLHATSLIKTFDHYTIFIGAASEYI